MEVFYFLLGITLLFGCLLFWGFRHLPGERWQTLAVVPFQKDQQSNSWYGLNLTYYGFFIATSQLFAIILLIILLGSLSISLNGSIISVGLLLLICVPASRIMAMFIEKKRHTFTIGGASFIGIVLAPWCILLTSQIFSTAGSTVYLPLIPTLAAMSICYTLGEGIGRLGCISYGCCYGKPVCQCSSTLQRLFKHTSITFTGPTKKAVYESNFAGQMLVPIQAITALIYTVTTVVCCYCFLKGMYNTALLISIVVSQGWRILSETLRADFRGGKEVSAYQKMGLVALLYVAGMTIIAPDHTSAMPLLSNGFTNLWNPGVIIGLQAMWLFFFYFFGRSTVTTSTVSIDVLFDRI